MCEEIKRYVGVMAECAYSTPLLQDLEDLGINNWIHGHVHVPLHVQFGKTRVDSNPMGYVDDEEHVAFQPGAQVIVKCE